MSWLLDTNVLSELRKGARCDRSVAQWFAAVLDEDIHLSVLVVVDSLLAATAKAHDLTLVTRSVKHVAGLGARYFKPFDGETGS